MRKLIYIFILFLLISTQSIFCEDKKQIKGIFYKISSEQATIYLLGSVFVIYDIFDKSNEIYPLRKDIEEAFVDADILYVTFNSNSNYFKQVEIDNYVKKMSLIENGMLLKDILPSNFYKTFKNKMLFDFGIYASDLQFFKPWYISGIVTAGNYSRVGVYKSQISLEDYFITKKKNKEFHEFESYFNFIDYY